MRAIIQRVSSSSVSVSGKVTGKIERGLLILLGIAHHDDESDALWLCRKITSMRIFPDSGGQMNLSVKDVNGSLLVVSQFTLHASTKKGNRPSFIASAPPDIALPLYQTFIKFLDQETCRKTESGEFGADMQVSIENDGPVTIMLDSKNKE